MPRKGENIRKRKDGRWEGRYIQGYNPDTNKAKYISLYGKTYNEVREKLWDAKYRQHHGECAIQNKRKRFGELAQEWLLLQKPFLKPASFAKYRNLMEQHIFPALGHLSLPDLTESKLHAFLKKQSLEGNCNTGGPLSISTLQSLLYLLNAVLEYGASQQLIHRISVHLPICSKKPSPVQALNPQDEKRLEDYLSLHLSPRNLGILLSLYCGLRLGEVCGLQWNDLDLNHGILQVARTVQRIPCDNSLNGRKTVLQISSPKTEASRRKIPMPCFLVSLCEALAQESSSSVYVISGNHSPMEPRLYQYYFKQLLQKAGVAAVNYHVLRHTFATNCVALGFDTKTLSEILGHSNVSITLSRYVHPTLAQKKEQMGYWDMVKGQLYGQTNPSPILVPAISAACP